MVYISRRFSQVISPRENPPLGAITPTPCQINAARRAAYHVRVSEHITSWGMTYHIAKGNISHLRQQVYHAHIVSISLVRVTHKYHSRKRISLPLSRQREYHYTISFGKESDIAAFEYSRTPVTSRMTVRNGWIGGSVSRLGSSISIIAVRLHCG